MVVLGPWCQRAGAPSLMVGFGAKFTRRRHVEVFCRGFFQPKVDRLIINLKG